MLEVCRADKKGPFLSFHPRFGLFFPAHSLPQPRWLPYCSSGTQGVILSQELCASAGTALPSGTCGVAHSSPSSLCLNGTFPPRPPLTTPALSSALFCPKGFLHSIYRLLTYRMIDLFTVFLVSFLSPVNKMRALQGQGTGWLSGWFFTITSRVPVWCLACNGQSVYIG